MGSKLELLRVKEIINLQLETFQPVTNFMFAAHSLPKYHTIVSINSRKIRIIANQIGSICEDICGNKICEKGRCIATNEDSLIIIIFHSTKFKVFTIKDHNTASHAE